MDRLLQALQRLADEPAPVAVEPLTASELREVERLAPGHGRELVGAALRESRFSTSALVPDAIHESAFVASDQAPMETPLGEAQLPEETGDPETELEGFTESDLSDSGESVESKPVARESDELESAESQEDSVESNDLAESRSSEELLTESEPAVIESEVQSETVKTAFEEELDSPHEVVADSSQISSESDELSKSAQQELGGTPEDSTSPELEVEARAEQEVSEETPNSSTEPVGVIQQLASGLVDIQLVPEEVNQRRSHSAETLPVEDLIVELEESDKRDSHLENQPGWEWAESPYLELLDSISQQHVSGVSRAFALTSIDDLPDRELAVAGLAKAYAVTTGGRALVVTATGQTTGRIAEGLGVRCQGTTYPNADDPVGAEIAKVLPSRHAQVDFLSLQDLLLEGHVSENSAIDPMLVTKWRAHYSLILLDTGCWGRSFVFQLARQCDAAYVFLGLGVTKRESALDVITRMKRGGIRVAGCVLTGSRSEDSV